jgi:hypothetical protein
MCRLFGGEGYPLKGFELIANCSAEKLTIAALFTSAYLPLPVMALVKVRIAPSPFEPDRLRYSNLYTEDANRQYAGAL